MDERIRRFGILSVRLVGRIPGFDGVNLDNLGRSIRLDRFETINTEVAYLVLGRFNTKSERDDLCNMRVWTKDSNRYTQALSK
jgi:hypothetical protein